ncbi:MAG TPA: sigma-54 dependent transcriptional regulator [Terriglobia bacterium]|nr:sigma-54 dependent transcriptional regulator [Terriglobia bacterium]
MMAQASILIVDDEKLIRWSMKQKLESWNYQVSEAEDLQGALRKFQQETPDLLTLDIKLPDGSGIDFLKQAKQIQPSVPVIMITAFGVVDVAVEALKLGAYDFIEKPINFEKLENSIRNALETHRLKAQVAQVSHSNKSRFSLENIVGRSKAIRDVLELVQRLAEAGATTLLVQGESGTGKDLVSRALHYQSARRDHPFFALNCAAIPETLIETELFGYEKGAFTDAKTLKKGVFEMADGGTVFLDEISEMNLNLQSKFLRVLEDQTFRRVGGVKDISVNVQVVASTNRNLEAAVKEGKFREDLFYRLSVIPILISPLRERKEDIPALVEHFIQRYNTQFRKRVSEVSPDGMKLIMNYSWPGNIRELKNAIERAMILADKDRIEVAHLPIRIADAVSAVPLPDASGSSVVRLPPEGAGLDEIEKKLVEQALQYAHGNKTKASKLLKISRDTLRYKVKKHNLK